ncbi:hypothetical protein ACJ41O_007543 [Fusarium nematophilum]
MLAAMVIGARVYLRLKTQRQNLVASDVLMILAWCSAVTKAAFDTVLKKEGVLEPNINYTLVNWDASPEKFEYMLRILWAGMIPFITTFYLCKASLLATYLQVFPFFMQKRRAALWVLIIYIAIAFIATMLLHLFLCFPIQRNWNIKEPEILCDGTVVATVFQVAWALHFSGSVAMFILPFVIFYDISMRTRVKISLCCVFLLAFIDISFSLTRFLTIQLSHVGDFRSVTTIEMWSALDAYICLIVACLPSLRPYLRHDPKAPDPYNGPTNLVPRRRHSQIEFKEMDGMAHSGMGDSVVHILRCTSNPSRSPEFRAEDA